MLLADFEWAILLSPFGIPIVGIVSVFVWLIIASISEEVGKVMRHRANNDLKLELLARGLPSDEIVRIIDAGHAEVESGVEAEYVASPPAQPMPGRI